MKVKIILTADLALLLAPVTKGWNIHYSYYAIKDYWELTLELARENTDDYFVDILSFQNCRSFRFFDESLRYMDLMSQYAKIN